MPVREKHTKARAVFFARPSWRPAAVALFYGTGGQLAAPIRPIPVTTRVILPRKQCSSCIQDEKSILHERRIAGLDSRKGPLEDRMQKRLSKLAFSGLVAMGLLAGSLVPSSAAVINTSSAFTGAIEGTVRTGGNAYTGEARADVVQVGHRRHWRRHHHHRRHWRHHHRRHWHRHHHRPRTGIYLHFGSPGYYAPPAYYYARPRYVAPRYRASGSHVEWCYARYRSYRAWDNTYQPYHGPRRQCVSPYY